MIRAASSSSCGSLLFLVLLLLFASHTQSAAFSYNNHMKVVEEYRRSKRGANLDDCEDIYVVTSNYACVIDGATSPTGRRWTSQQLKGGKWASLILQEAIRNLPTSEELSPPRLVQRLTDALHAAYQHEQVEEYMRAHPHERATASLVIYCHAARTIVAVGDCQFAFLDTNGEMVDQVQPEKYVDQVTASARAMFLAASRLQAVEDDDETTTTHPSSEDPGRDFIQPLLRLQGRFQNNPRAPELYRYWVLDGFPIDCVGIRSFKVPSHVRQVILATDGYPQLHPTLQETEADLFRRLQEDPSCIGLDLKSTKGVAPENESFDDRTYLRIDIGPGPASSDAT